LHVCGLPEFDDLIFLWW